MPKLTFPLSGRAFLLALTLAAGVAKAQTAFLNFDTIGQYTNNFSPWNDNGNGANGGNYSFEENTTDGVGGGGGVAVYQNNDTTAIYKSGSWNLATNGASVSVSMLVYADGLNSGDKVQVGVLNSTTNGFNSNPGASFETYRFVPAGPASWAIFEQYRTNNVTVSSPSFGGVTVTAGHWYKFVVHMTNSTGATGFLEASCALFDYGTNGLEPGANLITFSTVSDHFALNIASNTAVWPGVRAYNDAGISAFDDFLVYTPHTAPVLTRPLNDITVLVDSSPTFTGLFDGPGTISYSWHTNGVLVAGATNFNYTVPSASTSLTSVQVTAANANGSASSTASIIVIAPNSPIALTGYNRDIVIESNAVGPPYSSAASEFNPGEGTCFYQQGLPGTTYGLPASGIFNSVIDLTQFQFQPYTGNNALVMSGETGINEGALTLLGPAEYSSIAILANSASASPTSVGTVTLRFADGSTFTTNYDAADWFFNPGFALQGVDRIDIGGGGAQGGPTDPRFYQTTIDLGAIGASSKTLVSLDFAEAPGAGATAIYAVSGLVSGTNSFSLAVVTNSQPSQIQATSAILGGGVQSTGGYVPTARIFYGPADGGTNSAAWSNSVSLGYESSAFSQIVSNLSPGVTYYASVQADNIAGFSWARPPQIFTTPSVTTARVTNLPAANIAGTSATLAAQVLSTGGLTPVVTIFYGPSDGGTNAANWASSINLGLEGGYAAVTVPNLTPSTAYHFTAQASNSQGATWSAPSFSFTTLAANPPSTGVPMLTYHNDNARDGANTNETQLTLANVNTNTFGALFTYNVDGFVYAQPLVMTNVIVPGKGLHNVVFVATENDSVYAFDADSNEGPNANPLWQTSFLNPAAGVTTVSSSVTGSQDITPTIGITATPVIDASSGTLYVEVKTAEVSNSAAVYVHRLHALDITTGLERTNFHSPVVIQCTNYPGSGDGDNDGQNPSHVLWNPLKLHSRPALTLLNGTVYLSFASHGDNQPYHGWLFAYNATNFTNIPSVYNPTPNGFEGGFWDGGGGPSVDAQGNFYLQTGNGSFDSIANLTPSNNYAMTLLKFSTSNGLAAADFFTPSNAVNLSGSDQDLGSSAPIVLPDSAGSAAHRHLVVGGGKTSPIYLVDRDNMGRFNPGTDLIVQQFDGGPSGDRDITPAFYNNRLYIIDYNSRLAAYSITNALFNTAPVETPDGYDNKGGATVCISANGTSNAIAWAIYNAGGETPASSGVLRAYKAANLTQKIYSSDQIPVRDSAGGAVKFIAPTIVNGKVYVAGQYTLTVYGLGAFLPPPSINPNGGIFTNQVTVSFSDADAGTAFYYTTDGTTPTVFSARYASPFTLTNAATVQVIASLGGSVSAVTSAGFINSAASGGGLGLAGSYFSNQIGTFVPPATLARIDADINFNWTGTSPDPSIGSSNFSVRWTGCVQPQYNETYTFSTLSDTGARLWINGQLLINSWSNQSPTLASASIPMLAQQIYNIQMDYYYHTNGDAVAQLSWSSPSTPFAIVPQAQLYPVSNPPPVVVITSPTNTSLAADATMTLAATAAAQSNAVAQVAFYINGSPVGAITNLPYVLTTTGLAAGQYVLTAVASDTTGLSATSAPVNITINAGSGAAYGLTNYPPAPAFYNMPPVFTGPLPLLLSGTGVFASTPAMAPAATLIPYVPNTPLWSDGAQKVRYMSIPNTGAPYSPAGQIAFSPTGTWSFPAGTIFVKTFELLTNQSDPASLHRLETRLLVRDTNGAVYGVTYKWRADNSDADLLSSNLTEAIPVQTPGGVITQAWYYPSPSDCLQCHTPAANYVLGLNTRQLNNTQVYSNGVTDNELRAMNRAGLFYPAFDESQLAGFEQLSAVTNASASLVQRARSYLDANCAQCHQPGGTGPTFDARYDTPLASQNIIGVPAVKGNLGYDNVDIVTPGDVWRSSLYDRMNIVSPNIQMPPLARNLIDTNAVQLMAQWINSLGGPPALPPPAVSPAGGIYQGFVSVTITPPATNATLYYTLDGSLPTPSSALYTGPFLVTNSATVSANAFAPGYINSVVGTQSYTILPGVFFLTPGVFSNGAFQMTFAGPAGSNYVLQVSANLAQWTSIVTNTPASSPFVLSDTNTQHSPARFYRLLETP
ncbi:MAG TPA: chitobiase/beta-hexosaminidase C-terminal domain-containing protein [Verrucomicrobiae bacterium]|jgi:uncharacterized repeat protein (TIGR03806 family)